eukprot:scaffold184_cov316-Pinguiococcus_pyrenoidosus.AAC.18
MCCSTCLAKVDEPGQKKNHGTQKNCSTRETISRSRPCRCLTYHHPCPGQDDLLDHAVEIGIRIGRVDPVAATAATACILWIKVELQIARVWTHALQERLWKVPKKPQLDAAPMHRAHPLEELGVLHVRGDVERLVRTNEVDDLGRHHLGGRLDGLVLEIASVAEQS